MIPLRAAWVSVSVRATPQVLIRSPPCRQVCRGSLLPNTCFVSSIHTKHLSLRLLHNLDLFRALRTSMAMTCKSNYSADRDLAVSVVAAACRVARAVSQEEISSRSKHDTSPVTVADYAVQAIIARALKTANPSDGLVAEESAAALRTDPSMLRAVADAVRTVDHLASDEDVLESLHTDQRTAAYGGTAKGRTWVLDPIDGTRGFVAKRQYCVALALLENGVPRIGVLGCPNLPAVSLSSVPSGDSISMYPQDISRGVLFHAIVGKGAYAVPEADVNQSEQSLDHPSDLSSNVSSAASDVSDVSDELHAEGRRLGRRVRASDLLDPTAAVFCESFEAAHSSHELSARVASLLGVKAAPARMDSQAKYGAMARGDFHIFMRFPRGSYIENIWDHAAGVVVIEEAGGRVTDGRGRKLNFALGKHLDNDDGIVATNGRFHDKVVAAVQMALREQIRASK